MGVPNAECRMFECRVPSAECRKWREEHEARKENASDMIGI
jgi:hypothetical protein